MSLKYTIIIQKWTIFKRENSRLKGCHTTDGTKEALLKALEQVKKTI